MSTAPRMRHRHRQSSETHFSSGVLEDLGEESPPSDGSEGYGSLRTYATPRSTRMHLILIFQHWNLRGEALEVSFSVEISSAYTLSKIDIGSRRTEISLFLWEQSLGIAGNKRKRQVYEEEKKGKRVLIRSLMW